MRILREVRRGGLNSLKIVGYQKETEMKMGRGALVVEFELQSADGGIRTLCALMEQSHGELNLLKKFGIQKFELQFTDGGQSYRGLNFVESVGVQARRIQFSPQDLRDVLSSGGGDDDSGGSSDEDSGGSSDDDSGGSGDDDSGGSGDEDSGGSGDEDSSGSGDDDSGGSGDEDDNGEDEDGGGDGGDDEFYGFDLNGDDSHIVKKVVGEELIFTPEEVEKLVGTALGSDFQMIILSDKSYAARFDSKLTHLRSGLVIVSYSLAGPVWDEHMKDYLRVNSIVHEVHFGKTDDDFEEDVWCLYC